MTEKHSISDRLRYFFDQTIASGTGSLVLWIACISIAVVALAAGVLSVGIVPTGEETKDFGESFWSALGIALSPHTVESPGWHYRAVMLFVAIFGILIVSFLIGVLTTGIAARINKLRRGRSKILESNHTIILGWSSKIAPIIRELIIANENLKDAVVVVLADKDIIEMEEELTAELGNLKTTRLICRSGKPSDRSNLNIVSSRTARSFIVLREGGPDSDDDVIRVVLALRQECGSPLSSPIVAEISEPANADATARIDPQVSVINAGEIVIRIIAQAAREPGLSNVYETILSFAGDEIYCQHEPIVEGMSFAEASKHYESSILIGLIDASGKAILNPPGEQLIKDGESLIAIAEDDDKIIYSATKQKTSNLKKIGVSKNTTLPLKRSPEKILILGWHLQGKLLIQELEELLPTGSDILLLYNRELVTLAPELKKENISVTRTVRVGDTTDRRLLEEIDPTKFDHVIVLSYRDRLDLKKADSKTLLTLIHLEDLREKRKDFSITSEIIDAKTRALVQIKDSTSNFVASEDLVGKALVQVSENFALKSIFDELLTARGCEFHLRSIETYNITSPVTFFNISQTAIMRREIAVGYRNNGIVELNPAKFESIRFADDGAIIVLAEE